jgi:hypothetical protein
VTTAERWKKVFEVAHDGNNKKDKLKDAALRGAEKVKRGLKTESNKNPESRESKRVQRALSAGGSPGQFGGRRTRGKQERVREI